MTGLACRRKFFRESKMIVTVLVRNSILGLKEIRKARKEYGELHEFHGFITQNPMTIKWEKIPEHSDIFRIADLDEVDVKDRTVVEERIHRLVDKPSAGMEECLRELKKKYKITNSPFEEYVPEKYEEAMIEFEEEESNEKTVTEILRKMRIFTDRCGNKLMYVEEYETDVSRVEIALTTIFDRFSDICYVVLRTDPDSARIIRRDETFSEEFRKFIGFRE